MQAVELEAVIFITEISKNVMGETSVATKQTLLLLQEERGILSSRTHTLPTIITRFFYTHLQK